MKVKLLTDGFYRGTKGTIGKIVEATKVPDMNAVYISVTELIEAGADAIALDNINGNDYFYDAHEFVYVDALEVVDYAGNINIICADQIVHSRIWYSSNGCKWIAVTAKLCNHTRFADFMVAKTNEFSFEYRKFPCIVVSKKKELVEWGKC